MARLSFLALLALMTSLVVMLMTRPLTSTDPDAEMTYKRKYSFGVPGRWGSGKRAGSKSYSFAMPGRWGTGGSVGQKSPRSVGGDVKEDEDCPALNVEQLTEMYNELSLTADRINRCLSALVTE